jgi:hypothetical protein
MAEPGAIVSTTLREVIIFSGDNETREYDGRKHIGAADLLREMARRKAANPAWNDKAAIHRHSLRLPDMTRHLPARRAATTAGVCWARQLG